MYAFHLGLTRIHRLVLIGQNLSSYMLQVGGAAIVTEIIMINDYYDSCRPSFISDSDQSALPW